MEECIDYGHIDCIFLIFYILDDLVFGALMLKKTAPPRASQFLKMASGWLPCKQAFIYKSPPGISPSDSHTKPIFHLS
jgi:hypothetical protein